MSGRALRVLVADDEPLGRQRLLDLLAREPGLVVEEAPDGLAAVAAIRREKPDLVFLDVQMPGLTGIEVVREIGAGEMPPTIFVTAYDQYALHAFDVAALDYLVKPFDDERFEEALRRARKLIGLAEAGDLSARLRTWLDASQADAPAGQYLERVAVEMRGQVRVVAIADVEAITASGPYVELHTRDKTYLLRERLQALEQRLDPMLFARVHRSTIVRLDCVELLLKEGGGDYEVKLKSGRQLPVSRTRVESLQRWMGLSL